MSAFNEYQDWTAMLPGDEVLPEHGVIYEFVRRDKTTMLNVFKQHEKIVVSADATIIGYRKWDGIS